MNNRPYAECQREIMNRFWLVLAIAIVSNGGVWIQLNSLGSQISKLTTVQELQLKGKLQSHRKNETHVEWGETYAAKSAPR